MIIKNFECVNFCEAYSVWHNLSDFSILETLVTDQQKLALPICLDFQLGYSFWLVKPFFVP